MKWVKADNDDLSEIIEFLLPFEHFCVSLTSKLYKNGIPAWPEDKPVIAILRENNLKDSAVLGILYISQRGLALPVFSRKVSSQDIAGSFPSFLRKRLKKIHTCIGTKQTVTIFEDYKRHPKQSVDYFLYTQGPADIPPLPAGTIIHLHKATPEQVDLLFPLHEGYEREEVLLEPDVFNRKFHYLMFTKSLKEQIIYYGTLEDKPAVKAGTNAIGFNWCQLGGVYTLPSIRNRGFGSILVSRLCVEINNMGKQACLFVKANNPAALKLYQKLGFNRRLEYRISYFPRP